MSLLGHDDVIFFPGKMMLGFIFYLPVFFYCFKTHKMVIPYPKQIIYELWEEVMNFNQLTTFDLDVPLEIFEPWNDWENEFEKLPQVSALCFSVFWMKVLSLWSSIVSNLTKFYFFRLLDGLTWTKYRVELAGND